MRDLPAAAVALATLALCFQAALSSEGDAFPAFRACHATCQASGCASLPGQQAAADCDVSCPGRNAYQPPLALRLTLWDCASDCAYHCMWAVELSKRPAAAAAHAAEREAHAATGRRSAAAGAAVAAAPVVKYYGKWPFARVLGAQEAASVVFSAANVAAHVAGLRLYLRALAAAARGGAAAAGRSAAGARPQAPQASGRGVVAALAAALLGARPLRDQGAAPGRSAAAASLAHVYPYWWLWVLYGGASVNAFLWSCVFHTRDTRLTERLDYFSADLLVAVGLLVATARTLQLAARPPRLACAAAALGMLLGRHIWYMAYVKFDYGFNMLVCIGAGVATALVWLLWAAYVRHPGRRLMYTFMALVHAAMLLEVLDFPPLEHLVDAHALWHAATAPITLLWYRFVAVDVDWVAGGGGGSAPPGGSGGGTWRGGPQSGSQGFCAGMVTASTSPEHELKRSL